MTTQDQLESLQAAFGDLLAEPVSFRGETTVTVSDPERMAEVCRFAKDELGLNFLVDITSVDHYGDHPRWMLVYELANPGRPDHLRLKTWVTEEASELPSVSSVWRTADWHEREIYDMMGIRFRGHPDLRRILMWEGYPYHPLRKDFPLAGKPTDLPDVAFSEAAPLEGGPFVTTPGAGDAVAREPRSRTQEP